MVAAAQQTVSILGKFQDQISPSMTKVGESAALVTTNVSTADKAFSSFSARALALGTTLRTLNTSEEAVAKNAALTAITMNEAARQVDVFDAKLRKLTLTVQQLNAAGPAGSGSAGRLGGPGGGLLGFTPAEANAAAAGVEKVGAATTKAVGAKAAADARAESSSDKFARKTAVLTGRLIALQFIMAQASSATTAGGAGKFKTQIDAVTGAVTTFATTAALLPGPLGLALGAVAALAQGFAIVKQELFGIQAAADELEKKTKASANRAAAAAAERDVSIATSTAVENANRDQEQARANLVSTQTRLNQAREELAQLERKAESQQGFLSQPEVDRMVQLEQETIPNLTVDVADLNLELVKARNNFSQLESLEQYNEAMKGIAASSQAAKEGLELGVIPAVDSLNTQAANARAKLDLLIRNRELLKARPETSGIVDAAIRQAAVEARITEQKAIQARFAQEIIDRTRELTIQLQTAGDLTGGLALGFLEAAVPLADMTKLGERLGGALVQGISDFTGELIDGLVKGDLQLGQFAQNFLLNISKMIAQALVLKAITATLGLNSGGIVPTGKNAGGIIRASTGLHVPGPRINADVVPAMLTPGEFVIRRPAVEKYGVATMHAINRGVVPESALSGSRMAGSSPLAARFAEGGSVSSQKAPQLVPVIVAGDQQMEQLATGGMNGLLRAVSRNKEAFNAALDDGRRRG